MELFCGVLVKMGQHMRVDTSSIQFNAAILNDNMHHTYIATRKQARACSHIDTDVIHVHPVSMTLFIPLPPSLSLLWMFWTEGPSCFSVLSSEIHMSLDQSRASLRMTTADHIWTPEDQHII